MSFVKQVSVLDGLAFDLFSFQKNRLIAPEIDVGRRQIVDTLVVAQVVIVSDEGFDPSLELAGQIVVLQQDAVLECQMPALDLSPCHRMIGRAADMRHVLFVEPCGQLRRDVARAVVGERRSRRSRTRR